MRRKPLRKSNIHPLFSPITERMLRMGLTLILLSTLCTIFTLIDSAPLSAAETAYFATLAEYLITSTALLSAGAYLVERIARERKNK